MYEPNLEDFVFIYVLLQTTSGVQDSDGLLARAEAVVAAVMWRCHLTGFGW